MNSQWQSAELRWPRFSWFTPLPALRPDPQFNLRQRPHRSGTMR